MFFFCRPNRFGLDIKLVLSARQWLNVIIMLDLLFWKLVTNNKVEGLFFELVQAIRR